MKTAAIAVLAVLLAYGLAHSHTDLTPAEVRAWMDTTSSGVIVDVREESEFCDSTYIPPGHIPGAINMPWNSGYFQAHYDELPADEDIIIVCRSGNRSNTAANFLDNQEGYTKVFDMLGGMNAWLYETGLCTSAGVPGPEERGLPLITLGPAAPSPFTSHTEISYSVPYPETSAGVALAIYDARGRLVTTLVEEGRATGARRVAWDGTDGWGRPVMSGVYFYRLTFDGQSRTRRVVLLK